MQVFMIDERSHSGLMAMRAGGGGGVSLGGRMGDSMPDYDNVKVSFVMQMHEKLTFPSSSYSCFWYGGCVSTLLALPTKNGQQLFLLLHLP